VLRLVNGGIQKHWWTPELDDLKQQCIDATEMWKSAGRPRSGELNNIRIRSKFKYKSAIKEDAASAETAFNDELYNIYVPKTMTVSGEHGTKKFV